MRPIDKFYLEGIVFMVVVLLVVVLYLRHNLAAQRRQAKIQERTLNRLVRQDIEERNRILCAMQEREKERWTNYFGS